MSANSQAAAESAGAMFAKTAPPAGVSIATIAGAQVSDLVLWATLIYTVLMICHKLIALWRELRNDPRCKTGES